MYESRWGNHEPCILGRQHYDADDGRLFFAGACIATARCPFEQLLYGGFASLMCSGMLRALEGFVQNAGPTSANGFWMATMSLVNWTANVILPMFALTQLVAMALHMGGVVSEIYPGSTWIRKFRRGDRGVVGFRHHAPAESM